MKVNVKVLNEWLSIGCDEEFFTVGKVADDAISKYKKLRLPEYEKSINVIRICRVKNEAILDPDDYIRNVLIDDDSVLLITDATISNNINDHEKNGDTKMPQFTKPTKYFVIDGETLMPEDLLDLGEWKYLIKLSNDAWEKVDQSRRLVDEIIAENKVVYGITTGFGKFANVVIEKDKLEELQVSLIRSHACGVGSCLSLSQIRMLLIIRINVLCKGYSGISRATLQKCIDCYNESCLSYVPEKGSVGASGDLCPLAHLALGIIGEGRMWSPKTGWTEARHALAANGLTPAKLMAKEGLCLINGTQLITSFAAEALARSSMLCKQADVVASLTLEVLKGTTRAFDEDVHKSRPHNGQNEVARILRSLLHNDVYRSEISESHRFCDKVQDAYTIRCCPQVHGISRDTVQFVRNIITTEMNSATDNPIVLVNRGMIVSAGNFHGEYPAKACDYLAIAVHELASMSERRIERLVNPAYSALPAFLSKDGGLNSGLMMAHVTAAALVSENKVLCHPASVDSLTTSGGQEDHVSMGPHAARKALQVILNVENVLAIELISACQALEFLRPLKSTEPLEAVVRLVRSVIPSLEKDRYLSPDIAKATELLQNGSVWNAVYPYIQEYESKQSLELWTASPTTTSLKRIRENYPKKQSKHPRLAALGKR